MRKIDRSRATVWTVTGWIGPDPALDISPSTRRSPRLMRKQWAQETREAPACEGAVREARPRERIWFLFACLTCFARGGFLRFKVKL